MDDCTLSTASLEFQEAFRHYKSMGMTDMQAIALTQRLCAEWERRHPKIERRTNPFLALIVILAAALVFVIGLGMLYTL